MSLSRWNILPSPEFDNEWSDNYSQRRPNTLTCILEDGSIRRYDVMAKSKSYYSEELFTCIGRGWLINFHNPVLKEEDLSYFFVRNTQQIQPMEKDDTIQL